MKRLFVLALLVIATLVVVPGMWYVAFGAARTVRWGPVTMYTDNTLIEAGNAVTYSAWRQDNVTKAITQLADHISATSQGFSDTALVKGRSYNFWVQAHLQTGGSSDNSTIVAWALPLGQAATPVGVVVQ